MSTLLFFFVCALDVFFVRLILDLCPLIESFTLLLFYLRKIYMCILFSERCQRAIQLLERSELIECTSNGGISSRPFGIIMAKYFLSIRTMDTFRGVSTLIK